MLVYNKNISRNSIYRAKKASSQDSRMPVANGVVSKKKKNNNIVKLTSTNKDFLRSIGLKLKTNK